MSTANAMLITRGAAPAPKRKRTRAEKIADLLAAGKMDAAMAELAQLKRDQRLPNRGKRVAVAYHPEAQAIIDGYGTLSVHQLLARIAHLTHRFDQGPTASPAARFAGIVERVANDLPIEIVDAISRAVEEYVVDKWNGIHEDQCKLICEVQRRQADRDYILPAHVALGPIPAPTAAADDDSADEAGEDTTAVAATAAPTAAPTDTTVVDPTCSTPAGGMACDIELATDAPPNHNASASVISTNEGEFDGLDASIRSSSNAEES